jgi:purine nucleosidase
MKGTTHERSHPAIHAFRGVITALLILPSAAALPSTTCVAQPSESQMSVSGKEKVIIDTDIGGDIDDAFAVALALRSPELEILGVSTVSGDTVARAKIVDRMLGESGRSDIPVAAGTATTSQFLILPPGLIGLQRRYGEHGQYARKQHPPAVEFILEKIRLFPGQITLVTIGPLSNVGALIERDIATFRSLKRVVMMAGWVRPVSDRTGEVSDPAPEYNIASDVRAAQELFASGVPIYVMPIDSTSNLVLDEVSRRELFSDGTPVTDALALLYVLWDGSTPVLFDAMAVAYASNPQLCPVVPMRINVNNSGITQVVSGAANAQVCLHSDANAFLDYYVRRVVSVR